MTQVYIQPIPTETDTQPNIRIRVKPANSSDEFSTETYLNP
jgi:hypothetical protein